MTNDYKPIPITKESLKKMPRAAAKRMKIAAKNDLTIEFEEWTTDMGYVSMIASPILRQLLFEAFIGGWSAKIRQIKRKNRSL